MFVNNRMDLNAGAQRRVVLPKPSHREEKIVLWIGIIVTALVVIGLIAFFTYRKEESKKDTTYYPSESIYSPLSTDLFKEECVNSAKKRVECGYSTKREVTEEMRRNARGVIVPELKLINRGPVAIDVYYRDDDQTGEFFVASIPRGRFMYAYHIYDKNGEARMMGAGGEVFARFGENLPEGGNKRGELLYIPYMLEGTERELTFGAADSMTTHSRIVYNLMGEIMTIEFHNASNATYSVYYYGDCLGTLGPIGSGLDVMSSNNGNRGYRLNSKITLIMKGTNIKQELTLNNLRMDTLIVGKITSETGS